MIPPYSRQLCTYRLVILLAGLIRLFLHSAVCLSAVCRLFAITNLDPTVHIPTEHTDRLSLLFPPIPTHFSTTQSVCLSTTNSQHKANTSRQTDRQTQQWTHSQQTITLWPWPIRTQVKRYNSTQKTHHRATERHLPYGITQCLPTQMNVPPL